MDAKPQAATNPALTRMQSFILTGPLEEIEELAELLDYDEPKSCSQKQPSASISTSPRRLLPRRRAKTVFDSGDYFVHKELDERLEKYQKECFKANSVESQTREKVSPLLKNDTKCAAAGKQGAPLWGWSPNSQSTQGSRS